MLFEGKVETDPYFKLIIVLILFTMSSQKQMGPEKAKKFDKKSKDGGDSQGGGKGLFLTMLLNRLFKIFRVTEGGATFRPNVVYAEIRHLENEGRPSSSNEAISPARLAALKAAVLRIEARMGETPLTRGQKVPKRKKAPLPTKESEIPDNNGEAISSDGEEEAQAGLVAKRPC
uniref:Uncharacterized protein n=1 Tax=Romanomermis culicivorax TaxID=13658 RepID=A0A915L900_ROMCU